MGKEDAVQVSIVSFFEIMASIEVLLVTSELPLWACLRRFGILLEKKEVIILTFTLCKNIIISMKVNKKKGNYCGSN